MQRLRANDWRVEIFSVLFTVAFVLLFKVGDYYNTNLATKFLKGLSPVMTKNFFQYGTTTTDLYTKDSSESFTSYASGRQNIDRVVINLSLKPRQNGFMWFIETATSFFSEIVPPPVDKADIFIYPSFSAQYDNFIAAIVNKQGMNDARQQNYYLSLTKTVDSALLPPSFVYMSEASELHEKAFSPEVLATLDPKVLRYVAITDQPISRPEKISELEPRRRIIVLVNLTSNKERLTQLSEFLDSLFNVLDSLAAKKTTFRPEALRKVLKARETEVAKLQKIVDEEKKEELAEERAKQKRLEKRNSTLSEAEQAKAEKKALEKKQRKQMKKQRVRM